MTQTKQIKAKIKEILKDEKYTVSSTITANIIKVFPENKYVYTRIREKLVKGLDCRVSELRFGWFTNNVINIYMDIKELEGKDGKKTK